MKKYVAGFMFSPDFENVILIEKEKPDWQKGKYNAVGGKIEDNESPLQAMVREFREETSIKTNQADWFPLCLIGDDNYQVHFFFCAHPLWGDYMTMTDENVFHVPLIDLYTISHKVIENLNWLIPLALDKAKSFSGVIEM